MKLFFIINSLNLVFISCASLSGSKQIVGIDSEPRQIEIYDGKERLGETPQFIQLRPKYTKHLEFKLQNEKIGTKDFTCSIRWGMSILGNCFLGLFYPALIPIGLLTDYVSGAMFECPYSVKFTFDKEVRENKKSILCYRYLVLPPLHVDEKISDQTVEIWRAQFLKNSSCHEVIYDQNSKSYLKFYDIDNYNSLENYSEYKNWLSNISYDFDVDYLVRLNLETEKDGKEKIQPELIYLHDLSVEKKSKLPITEQKDLSLKKKKLKDYIYLMGVSFFPNSITWGPSGLQPELMVDDTKYQNFRLEEKDKLPRTLSNFSLQNVEHSKKHSDWSWSFRFSPWIKNIYFAPTFYYQDQEAKKSFPIFMESIKIVYNAELTFHTLIGAFGFGLGMGPSYVYGRSNYKTKTHRMSLVMTSFTNYVAFITERVYWQLFIYQDIFQPKIDLGDIKIRKFYDYQLAIGYFFPESKSWVRNLW